MMRRLAWGSALAGLALVVFAVVALSSSGRIDVVDGYTRYEVGRSLVEHRDSIVRNADAWFYVFPGRNGDKYTQYRFPQSLVAAAAICTSDATGPVQEGRRQFFFVLSNAVICALTACLYACWFRRLGRGVAAAIGWAAAGIFCTPTWFYSATAFDDVLGTLVVLAALYASLALRERWRLGAVVGGLLLGLAFNCKPPLALLMPAVVGALWRQDRSADERWLPARMVFFCTAIGVIGYGIYDLWKFPPSTWAGLAEARSDYVPLWPSVPLAGVLSLLISPGMGAIWYWPALIVAVLGLRACCPPRATAAGSPTTTSDEAGSQLVSAPAEPPGLAFTTSRHFALMVGLSCLAFLAFIGSIRFFSGEPAWGPRYLTPVFGVLWVFVPLGAARLGWKATVLLAASLLIQVAGLTIEPMRFFAGGNVEAAEGFLKNPWTYFRFDRSQLLARPQQLWEVLSYDGPPAPAFTPAKSPTLPLIIYVKTEKRMEARDYQVLSTLRPWWCGYRYLPDAERPVNLHQTLRGLLFAGGAGLAILALSLLGHGRRLSNAGRDSAAPQALALRRADLTASR
ncbi:MAG TPA: hypothetical protein VG125_04115 [Pirellulales bacterium]|jgi:hypothetical protein|nr:hypothetical protein [Pirellulales bacterium]